MMQQTPAIPLKAHYRLMLRMLGMDSKKYEPKPEELDRAAEVFEKAGGSWVKLFDGSVEHLTLMKKVLSVARKHKYLTKKPDWTG